MEIENRNQLINLDDLLEILGNPTRRVILAKLAKVPHSTSELARSLNISRQAVHSQLEILNAYSLIQREEKDKRGGKYRIKSNLSVNIDISPDYYNIKYSLSQSDPSPEIVDLKKAGYSGDYDKLKDPNEKIRYLGEKIREIEQKTRNLEEKRSELIQNKECLIIEVKKIMDEQFKEKFIQEHPDLTKLEREIFYTLFFNPGKYRKRINIDNLLDDLFFSNLTPTYRARNRVSIETLLKDLSSFMDFLWEDDDKWFIDI